MVRAADYLEKLARNQLERSAPLEIGACLPAPGPSMGPGFLAHDSSGKSFDPVPNLEETFFFCWHGLHRLAMFCCNRAILHEHVH
jgi:hypothetical protein